MFENILTAVEVAFDVRVDDLLTSSRSHALTRARHAAALIMRDAGGSVLRIGTVLRRHHTTIMDSVKRARRLAGDDAEFSERLAMARNLAHGPAGADLLAVRTLPLKKRRTPPAARLEGFRRPGDTIEDAEMRASVERASAKLIALLHAEAAQ